MKLSIITINYNNLDGLRSTVASVNAVMQEYSSEIQYIVIDGQSTDGSAEFIRSNSQKFNDVVIEPDGGIYEAINKGIRKSTGDYILILNSGDVLVTRNIRKILSLLTIHDIYYCDVLLKNGTSTSKHVSDHTQLTHRMSISHQGALVSRQVYKKGLYNEEFKLSADFAFFNSCLLNGYSFQKIDMLIAEFQTGGRSDTLFITSRLENLHALFLKRQYYYIILASLRYLREGAHIAIRSIVN